jgi:S-adenosylmethionine synthetase
MYTKTIASEFVSAGHPDKISDQIADALLDEYLRRDPNSRTGIEVMVKDNIVVLGGEVNSAEIIDYETAVRNVFDYLREAGRQTLSFGLIFSLRAYNIKYFEKAFYRAERRCIR